MTHDASHSYTYDAESRITKVDGGSTATYGYDADGRRVSRVVAGVETDYIYDLSGRVVADYGGGCGATCWRVGYIYLNGEMVAEYFGGTYFVRTDHLGSTRLLTGYPTASVVECDDYYPFGEQISCGGTSTTTHKFTGYERDSESGNDYAMTREYVSRLGRFSALDPLGGNAANPQTLNRYTYAGNNPISAVDRTGTTTTDPQQSQDGTQGDAPGTPHDLPADPTAGAPVGTPDDLPPDPCADDPRGCGLVPEGGDDCATNPFSAKCALPPPPPPGDVLSPDDLGLPNAPILTVDEGGVEGAVRKAIERALEALQNPDCRDLFSPTIDPMLC